MIVRQVRSRVGISLFVVFLIFLVFTVVGHSMDNDAVLLTWEDDPRESMTITMITSDQSDATLYATANEETIEQQGEVYTFEDTNNWIVRFRLSNLTPGTRYHAVIKSEEQVRKNFYFETLPDDGRELTFVAGADSRTYRDERRMISAAVAKEDPAFVLFQGDLIENQLSEAEWNDWLVDWDEMLVTEDNRRIPIIPAIGNHEVNSGYYGEKEDAIYYYNYFNLPGNEKYYALEISDDLVIITLDSDHTSRIEGEQTEWLSKTLQEHQDKEWIVAQYHVPAWPSKKDFYGEHTIKVREYWVPLFEKYGVDVAFEAHDHTFKMTESLKVASIPVGLQALVQEGIQRAVRDYDPDKSYSPWTNQILQELSKGNWEDDFENPESAMGELIYHVALYLKQSSSLSDDEVKSMVFSTALYPIFWEYRVEETGPINLVNKKNGVIYMGDGGWGAPLRQPRDADQEWWLRESSRALNYFVVTVSGDGAKLVVEPRLFTSSRVNRDKER